MYGIVMFCLNIIIVGAAGFVRVPGILIMDGHNIYRQVLIISDLPVVENLDSGLPEDV